VEEDAIYQLKQAQYECTRRKLYTIRYSELFGVHVDASKYAVGACLMQWNEDGTDNSPGVLIYSTDSFVVNWYSCFICNSPMNCDIIHLQR